MLQGHFNAAGANGTMHCACVYAARVKANRRLTWSACHNVRASGHLLLQLLVVDASCTQGTNEFSLAQHDVCAESQPAAKT